MLKDVILNEASIYMAQQWTKLIVWGNSKGCAMRCAVIWGETFTIDTGVCRALSCQNFKTNRIGKGQEAKKKLTSLLFVCVSSCPI